MSKASTRTRRLAIATSILIAMSLGACSSSSDGGKKLPLGTEAVVPYTVPASGTVAAVDTTIGVTVLAVRPGTQAELTAGGIQVDDNAKDATPYYVDVKYADKGTGSLKRNLSVSMEDTKGDSVPTTLIVSLGGTFTLCADGDSSDFKPGESYEGCTLFLVPKGRKIARVRFVSQAPDAKITFTDWATS